MMMQEEHFDGAVGLLKLLNVQGPCVKEYGNRAVTIIDKDYYWLQFAPKDQNYWLTIMYNQQEEIQQFYFDITQSNTILPNGESWFYDLYLDIVLLPDGTLFLLDEDELEEALTEGIITKEQYDNAYQWANRILHDLKGRTEELIIFCNKYFRILKEKL
jgi:predicted RNA-binding protein associated with RNAse of E/G family